MSNPCICSTTHGRRVSADRLHIASRPVQLMRMDDLPLGSGDHLVPLGCPSQGIASAKIAVKNVVGMPRALVQAIPRSAFFSAPLTTCQMFKEFVLCNQEQPTEARDLTAMSLSGPTLATHRS